MEPNTLKRTDPSYTGYVTVGTQPEGIPPFEYDLIGLASGSQLVVTTILNDATIPNLPRTALSKWECFWSVFIFGNKDEDFLWPTGSLLTGEEKKMPILAFFDWATSFDLKNQRVHRVIITNTTSGSIDLYVYRKFYTTTASTGS